MSATPEELTRTIQAIHDSKQAVERLRNEIRALAEKWIEKSMWDGNQVRRNCAEQLEKLARESDRCRQNSSSYRMA